MEEKKFIKKIYNNSLWAVTLAVFLVQICSIINNILVGVLVGNDGLSIMSLVNPVNFAFATVGSLLAVGGSIVSAQSIGERNFQKSNDTINFVNLLVIIIGILMTTLAMLFSEQVMIILNVPPALKGDTKAYLTTFLPSSVAAMGIYIPFNYLKITGNQKFSVYFFGVMAVCNIVLDFLFASTLSMGMAGIGLATTISYWVAFLSGTFLLYSGRGGYKISKIKTKLKDLFMVVVYGSPSATNNLCNLFRVYLFNIIVFSALKDTGLVAFSVISTIFSFAVVAFNGTSMSMAQFVAVFSAERDIIAQKQVAKSAVCWGTLMTGILSFLIIVFPQSVCKIFSITDEANCSVVIGAVSLFSLSLVPALINSVLIMFHQSNRHAVIANILTVFRGFLFVVAIALLLSKSDAPHLLWLSFLIAELTTLILGGIISFVYSKINPNLSKILLINTYTHRIGKDLSLFFGTDNDEAVSCSETIKEFCEQYGFPPKTVMTIGLAIEEIIVSFNQNALSGIKKPGKSHVRILIYDDVIVLRFRTGGRIYDPILASENDDDLMSDSLGIRLVKGLATTVIYNRVFGVNNLIITI